MPQNTAVAAAKALRLLDSPDLRHPPTAGPAERRAPSTTPGAPLNLALVDHLAQTADEIVALTRDTVPDAGPLPDRLDRLYDWCIEHTGNAGEAQRAYRDLVFERQHLEHAVRLGEIDEICKHPCPRCGCWGLMWDRPGNWARCTNRRCKTPDGRSSTWTLARLAAQKIQRTEIWRRNAT